MKNKAVVILKLVLRSGKFFQESDIVLIPVTASEVLSTQAPLHADESLRALAVQVAPTDYEVVQRLATC